MIGLRNPRRVATYHSNDEHPNKKGGSAALLLEHQPQPITGQKSPITDHGFQCLTAAGAGASVTGGSGGATSSSDSGSGLRSSANSNTLSIHFTG